MCGPFYIFGRMERKMMENKINNKQPELVIVIRMEGNRVQNPAFAETATRYCFGGDKEDDD